MSSIFIMSDYSEDILIEIPTIELLQELGWEHINALHETFGPFGTLGRDNQSEIILESRLGTAFKRLNPNLPPEAYALAFEELARDLLLPKLISGESDVSESDIKIENDTASPLVGEGGDGGNG
jgi:type I site-specific restriction-modification system R (restriction) subunit